MTYKINLYFKWAKVKLVFSKNDKKKNFFGHPRWSFFVYHWKMTYLEFYRADVFDRFKTMVVKKNVMD